MRCEFTVEELIRQCYLIWNNKKKKGSLSFSPALVCLKALISVIGLGITQPENLDGIGLKWGPGIWVVFQGPTVISFSE